MWQLFIFCFEQVWKKVSLVMLCVCVCLHAQTHKDESASASLMPVLGLKLCDPTAQPWTPNSFEAYFFI